MCSTEYAHVALLDCRALRDSALFAAALERVDGVRRGKVEACDREEDRSLSLGVGLLAAELLREHGIDPARLTFDENGKPAVTGGGVYISLSHAGDWAMAGLSDAPVAVDVELHGPDEWGIAKHFYTLEEQEALASAPDPEELFWRIWSRKECIVKRDGLRDLRAFSVLDAPTGSQFREYHLPGYSCVVLTEAGRSPVFRTVRAEEILNMA